jgi:CHAT domain-containing protein
LVLYDRSRNGWRAFVVHGDRRIDRVELDDAESALRDTWPSLRILLETAAAVPKSRRPDFLERTRAEAHASLERLRGALWHPLPIETDRIIVVPFADLHSVPIEAIAAASRNAVVTRLPHPALLRSDRPQRHPRALLLHGGDEEARREVRDIARLLRSAGTTVRLGSRRSALFRERQPLGILHVAAHGAFHFEGWLRSGIRLRDGWLGFERLRPAQLRGALVQFMSCESGQSRRLPGSDLEGWTTAALAAGARELVLTLW